MMFRELMAAFGEKIGLAEPIEIDEDGLCSFDVGDATVAMQGVDEIETLSLSADVGTPPPENLEPLYRELLQANDNFRGTGGATLSLDPRTGAVRLCRYAPYSALDADRLSALVLGFIEALADWRQRVRDFRADASSAPADESKQGLDGFLKV